MLKNHTCIAPFINLTVDPEHNTSPCPYLGGGAWKFSKEENLQKIWNSKQFESLRQSHLENKKSPICQRCWNEEEAGKESARLRFLKDHKNNLESIADKIKNKKYSEGPTILTMKNGNICNLRCRTCGPKDSSVWIPEAQTHAQNFPDKIKDTWFLSEPFKKNWNTNQMKNFETFSVNLERIEHFGGEPLYNPLVLEHTKMLVDSGKSKNIVLYFNTNGTHIPSKELQSLFKYFKQIEFNLSIDGTEKHFEYIRYPAKWTELLETKNWLEKQDNTIWGIVTTVSNLNVFYLDEIVNLFLDWNKTNVFLNILENPNFYNIQNLPSDVKKIITNKFHHIEKLQSVVRYMNSQEPNLEKWKLFKFWTEQSDRYRKQQFNFTFPEFSSII